MKLCYIIEDHEVIRGGVVQYLKLSGFEAEGYGTVKEAEEAFARKVPDILIQDIMLPDGDGFLFVREVKKKNPDLPVIFLTARQDESDKIMGFELGADDYVTKPFSPKELILRIQALFRRIEGQAEEKDVVVYTNEENTLVIDKGEHTVTLNNEKLVLTMAEWKMLVYLSSFAPSLVTRAKILEECFNYNFESYERVVDTHIKNIRAKLKQGSWIETVRGYGYRFTGEIKT